MSKTIKPKPVTIRGGSVRFVSDLKNVQLYKKVGNRLVILRKEDTLIACFLGGNIKNFPKEETLNMYKTRPDKGLV